MQTIIDSTNGSNHYLYYGIWTPTQQALLWTELGGPIINIPLSNHLLELARILQNIRRKAMRQGIHIKNGPAKRRRRTKLQPSTIEALQEEWTIPTPITVYK